MDRGLHHTEFPLELPSAGDTFDFHADVWVEWRVNRACTVVADHLADVREALAPVVRARLCEITRQFDVGDVIKAERAVAEVVHHLNPGGVYGLTVVLTIRLSADPGATEYAASRREHEHAISIQELEHARNRLQITHEREVIEARMDLYRRIIDSGDVEQLALQLAQNPTGVESIVSLVRDERHRDRRQVTDFLTHLLGSGAIDRWDVDDHVRAALEWLKDSTDRTVQTGDVHVPRERRSSRPVQSGPAGDDEPVVLTDSPDDVEPTGS
ncbi:MAG: hypothetical protein ABW212_20370 [Pseudonocardia sediminis]